MEIHQPKLYPKSAPRTSIEEHTVRIVSKILRLPAVIVLISVFALATVGCGQEPVPTQVTTEQAASEAPPTLHQDVAAKDLIAAPDFTLPAANKDNTQISLSSFQRDRPVVLVFYRAYW